MMTFSEHLKAAHATAVPSERRARLAAAEGCARRPIDHCKVAAAYTDLGDKQCALRCAAEGEALASDAREIFQVATAYAKAGAPDSSRALLVQIEEVLSPGKDIDAETAKRWRRLSRTYLRELKDESEAERCLVEALKRAGGIKSCFQVAQAWQDWGGKAERVTECAEQALEFVDSFEDLLQCANKFHRLGVDPELIRQCLDGAYRLTRGEISEIADGYRDLLGDDKSAGRVELAYVPAELFVQSCRSLPGWTSDAGALLTFFCEQVDEVWLQSIANADYANDYDGRKLAVLSRIAETGRLPDPFPWQLGSELDLSSYGEDTFACTLLCLRESHPHADWSDQVHQTIAVLIESCIEYGPKAMTHLQGLLVTMAESHPWEDTPTLPFILFGLLLTSAWLDQDDARLPALVERIVEYEEQCGDAGYVRDAGWLLGLTRFDLRDDVWHRLTHQILGDSQQPHLKRIAALSESWRIL